MFELCVAYAFLLLCDIDIGLHDCMSSGHCFWEKTSNGCKNDDDTFTHNAYDFYELCRAGKRKGATFNCEKAPAKLTAGQCKDWKINGHKQKESSSGKADDKDDYYYLEATTEKKFVLIANNVGGYVGV